MTRWLASLPNRVFLSSALLVVLALGAAMLVVNAIVTSQAERNLARRLDEAGSLVEQYRESLGVQLAQQARLIADLPKFKAAVALEHAPTLRPIAADYRQQVAADLLVVTGRQGAVLAAEGARQDDRLDRLSPPPGGGSTVFYLPRGDAVLQVVVVPVWIDPAAPELLGHLALGKALDVHVAERIKSATAAEVAFAIDGTVRASTLATEAAPVLAGLLADRTRHEASVGLSRYVGEVYALNGDLPSAPSVIVLRSRAETQGLLRALQGAIAATGGVAVLLATLLGYAVSRTITRPLQAITVAVRDMATTGDLTRRIELPAGTRLVDEDARVLAATVNSMTASIARFQQEAAQRERLSSLGRLSTVIAHEVRNPLMIIRTALRTLRKREVPDGRVDQAVRDIDEEVERLNRLVNDVLDFARPVTLELAPASLSAICRSAASAASVGDQSIPCELSLDERADAIVTDPERLRQVLVNLLVNARQAVAAQADGRPRRVALATALADDDRVQIVVRDTGVGIAPVDRTRVFEPYFTTRRTGSGLGLAIVRNIAEGLGGTVAVDSTPGEGTGITVELPRVSHRAMRPGTVTRA